MTTPTPWHIGKRKRMFRIAVNAGYETVEGLRVVFDGFEGLRFFAHGTHQIWTPTAISEYSTGRRIANAFDLDATCQQAFDSLTRLGIDKAKASIAKQLDGKSERANK